MSYSIGEVAKLTSISISTLRYYDKEGLFPTIERTDGGIRVFEDREIEVIKIIECLKKTGMSIKELKQFMGWCFIGDETLQQRRELFNTRLSVVNEQIRELEKTLAMIKYKCWYYDEAIRLGSEKDVIINNEEIKKLKDFAYE